MTYMTRSFVMLAVAVCAGADAAEQGKQTTFSSPERAAEALYVAARDGDEQALSRLFGGETEMLSCGDEQQDGADRRTFVAKYAEMHRLGRDGDAIVLFVGAENWPFPVPLAAGKGGWFFDTHDGLEQVRLRRIGENEISVIELVRSLRPDAQEGAPRLVGNTVPIDGYMFRKLQPAGEAPSLVAYPAVYGSSGIMTFAVGRDGTVYERDLGPRTAQVAQISTTYRLDENWHAVE